MLIGTRYAKERADNSTFTGSGKVSASNIRQQNAATNIATINRKIAEFFIIDTTTSVGSQNGDLRPQPGVL
jgi:hypothetical protein